ncbi:hypothetical protein KUTeg_010410 [Tegillarca granosa]|uniref:Protein rogdi n=1 Tax=Tegillarca granosa TaxID=220873 RepID=A0ABQ9F9K5_TEGGR|nr:hypothetical protein KUTeg_010410 [Tegillarca granosa]
MKMADSEDEEIEVLRKELCWLLEDQVHPVLEEIRNTLLECCRRFPHRSTQDEHDPAVETTDDTPSYRCLGRVGIDGDNELLNVIYVMINCYILFTGSGTGNVYCVVTLLGDSICDADINFKHKQGKDHHTFKTGINPEVNWKLQQIQDAGNFLYGALSVFANIDKDKKFTSAKQVLMLLDTLMNYLNQGRSCLAFPKRKSVDELVNNRNMTTFKPPVPSDVALSFYIHSSKLILALYNLQVTNQQKIEITSRSQVECTVQWLNEAVMLFTLALQQCSQLKDKITVLQQYEIT